MYSGFVASKVKSGEAILDSLTPEKAHIIHMSMGVAGEAGELIDAIKKYTMYNKQADMENIIEELGDLEFYMEGLRQAFRITREETIEANVIKLEKRYHKGSYSDQQAQDRADKQCSDPSSGE